MSRRSRAAGANPFPVDARPSCGYWRITALLNGQAAALGQLAMRLKGLTALAGSYRRHGDVSRIA